jgi:DNA adenine methylase
MLSNHNTPFINELYKDYRKEVVLARRSVNSDASKRGNVEETVILNY